MIDLHSHILHNVDDGSKTIDEAISLLNDAISQGISVVVFTPHYEQFPTRMIVGRDINEQYELLKQKIISEKLNIDTCMGAEVTFSEDILRFTKKLPTINNSRYLLLELDFYDYDVDIGEYIYELSLSGYQVIIAHVERYIYTNYQYVEMLVREGALIQINAISLLSKDPNIKKLLFRLIKDNLVHFVASDVHSGRDNKMLEAYQLVAKKIGKEKAEELFEINPRKVLLDEEI